MIRRKTVFIVGAGASCEFGFPAGDQLKSEIAKAVSIRTETFRDPVFFNEEVGTAISHLISRKNSIKDHSKDRAQAIKASQQYIENFPIAPSIDNYIETRKGDYAVEAMGKAGISSVLLAAEARSALAKNQKSFSFSKISDSWLAQLSMILNEGANESNFLNYFDNISFITFNYDRCIERFFDLSINNYFSHIQKSDRDAVLNKLKVTHVYGSLGEYDENFGRHGEEGLGEREIIQSSLSIKTFTESKITEEQTKEINSILSGASRMIFLGFSYGDINLEILSADSYRFDRIFMTTFGFSDPNSDFLKSMISYKYARREGTIGDDPQNRVYAAKLKASDLIKDYRHLIMS